jgi:predicted Zn finger-like uncharacterized protein
MTLRIQCPACERQFKVGEELKGRTVECGACEHRFKLDEGVTVERRDKFYPGEKQRPGLDAFGRSQRPTPGPVAFETAAYNQTQSVADFVPMSPQKMFATGLGTAVLAMTAVLFILGTMPNGMLKDMEIAKRSILGGFMVLVGAALVLYGCSNRRKTGILVSVVGVVTTMALSLFMPVPRTIDPNDAPLAVLNDPGAGLGTEEDPRAPIRPKTAEEIMQFVGYNPVQRAIASHTTSETDGKEFVTAIWVPVMEERYKFQILKYLHRKTASEERPSFYRRKEGGLFVIDGPRISMERVAGLVERFGRVEEIYPEIRLIEVMIESSRLIEASKDLMSKLTDREHPAFFVRNLAELDHIDFDRVSDAVQRLSNVEPLRFRVEISRRLLELLDEESESAFKGDVCRALIVWSEEGDGAEAAVARAAKEVMGRGESMPRSMLEFLVKRKAPEVVPILEVLWLEDPSAWEPIVAEIGPTAEDAVLKHLSDESPGVRLSAIQLLKRIGTKKSIEPLRALLPTASDEMKILIQEVIESL